MIIVKIMGGFASQLNKFVLGIQLAQYLNTDLAIDIREYFDGYFRPYSLCYLEFPKCIMITNDRQMGELGRICPVKNSSDFLYMLEKGYDKRRNYYLEREESDYREALRQFRSLEISPESNIVKQLKMRFQADFYQEFMKEVAVRKNSVAIHVRRGDFLKLGWQDDMDFYQAAIAWFWERKGETHFYFFSSDIEWVMEHFPKNPYFHFVNAIDGIYGDIQEVFCMAGCQFRILSKYSGYGRLANIYSSSQKGIQAESFAVMNVNNGKMLEGQEDEEKWNIIYKDEIERFEVVRKEDGGIIYLTQAVIEQYQKKYQELSAEKFYAKECRVSEKKEKDINGVALNLKQGDSIQQLLFRRWAYYDSINNAQLKRECLERMCLGKKTKKIWMDIYGITGLNGKNIIITTDERWNRWKIRGMYLMALILARCGANVRYINWENKISGTVDNKSEDFVEAENMDGERLGFVYYNKPENIQWSVIFSKREKGILVLIDGAICRGMPFYDEVEYFKIIRKNMRLGIYEQFQKKIQENRDNLYLRFKGIEIKKVYMDAQRTLPVDSIDDPSTVQEFSELPYLQIINSIGNC